MPSTINLDVTNRGTVAADGTATVQLAPASNQEKWTINRIIVSCDGAAASVCAIYRNNVVANQEIASTISGNNDTDYNEELELHFGERMYAVWAQATPGSGVIVSVQGAKEIAGVIY